MKKTSLLFFLILFCPCRGIYSLPISLYFTPDSGTDQIIMDLVSRAEKSVYIASYSFSWEKLADELNKKGHLDVKIIVDKQPPAICKKAEVKVDGKSSLFHPKLMIVDGRFILTGSGNFTESGFFLHHNNFLLLEDERIGRFLTEKFHSWWQDKPVDGEYKKDNIHIGFSPENDCEEIISEAVSSASETIYFALYHFTSEKLASAMIKRKLAGVNVCGMIENFSVEPHSVFGSLKNFGCVVRRSNRAGYMHDKFIVVDGETVITGSYNLTAAARRNNEAVIIIKDKKLASEFIKEWKRMWRCNSLP